MGNNVVINKNDGEVFVFEDVLGHQVGNGAVQIMERNGNQSIHANFDSVIITLDDEARTEFENKLDEMENPPAPESAEKAVVTGGDKSANDNTKPVLEVVENK